MKIVLESNDLDKDIEQLIKKKIKQVLDSDNTVKRLVVEVVNENLEEKIEKALENIDLKVAALQVIDRKVLSVMPPNRTIAQSIMTEIKFQVSDMLKVDGDSEFLLHLLAPEIEEVRKKNEEDFTEPPINDWELREGVAPFPFRS